MDIQNIALVRATNVIPFEGIVRPISEVPYLKKEKGTQFAFAMFDLLKKCGKFKTIDWTKPDEISQINKENDKILEQYMPYNSDYNSMVLWSLNGLVPDDMNNVFSNKTCAIIDSLGEQIRQSEIVSLVPTDTAIKGSVKLSKKASILIDKKRYEDLSEKEKNNLNALDLSIIVFEGDLKEAVDKELEGNGQYTAETLSLSREDKGYMKSDTSDELIQAVEKIAIASKIAQVLHWNVITKQNDELDKLECVKDEFENGLVVTNFYKDIFLKYLFSKMDINNEVKRDVSYMPESPVYIEALSDEIERIGIDKYKDVLDKYNKSLEILRDEGKLPTPQEIVDSNGKLDILELIEGVNLKSEQYSASGPSSILASAIEATESNVTIQSMSQNGKEIENEYNGNDLSINNTINRSE